MSVNNDVDTRKLFFLSLMCSLIACTSKLEEDFEIREGLMRSNLISKSLPEQREIFSSLPSEMKSKLYCYKFSKDLKEQKLSIKQRRFLKELRDFASIETYDSAPISPLIEANFLSRMDLMGWDEHDMFKYTMTFMTVNEYDDYMNKRLVE